MFPVFFNKEGASLPSCTILDSLNGNSSVTSLSHTFLSHYLFLAVSFSGSHFRHEPNLSVTCKSEKLETEGNLSLSCFQFVWRSFPWPVWELANLDSIKVSCTLPVTVQCNNEPHILFTVQCLLIYFSNI